VPRYGYPLSVCSPTSIGYCLSSSAAHAQPPHVRANVQHLLLVDVEVHVNRSEQPLLNDCARLHWQTGVHGNFDPQRLSGALANPELTMRPRLFPSCFGTTPLPQNLTIGPIFIADSVSLAVSREKDGKLRIVYAGWDNANVVQPNGYGQARSGWRRIYPLPGGALTPPEKLGPPS